MLPHILKMASWQMSFNDLIVKKSSQFTKAQHVG